MGDEIEWQMMWGAKVKMKNDMADDMLKYAIETCRETLDACEDFDTEGLKCAEQIKLKFDEDWGPNWHVIIGRNFGSFVTHETKKFVFFYLGERGIMLFKAG